MNKYDFYISLGPNCIPAFHLKNMKLRKEALPFDWMLLNHMEGIDYINNLILTNFDNYLKDLIYNEKNKVISKHYPKMVFFHHDLILNVSHTISKYDENNKDKLIDIFKRRANRFQDIIKMDKKILFIYALPLSSYKKSNNLELEMFWKSINFFMNIIGKKELLLLIYNDKDFNLDENFNNININRLYIKKFIKNVQISKLWGDSKDWINMFIDFI